jgi:hypothetical protein
MRSTMECFQSSFSLWLAAIASSVAATSTGDAVAAAGVGPEPGAA